MTHTVTFIECPCCGDVGAESNAEGYYHDGQELVCGCAGLVSCDCETPPYISIFDCDCFLREPAAKGPSKQVAVELAKRVEDDGATGADLKTALLAGDYSRPKLEMIHEHAKAMGEGGRVLAHAVHLIWQDRRK